MLRDQRTNDGKSGPAGVMPREERVASLPVALGPTFDALERYRGRADGRLLYISRDRDAVLAEAARRGIDATVLAPTDLSDVEPTPGESGFDIVALDDVLDAVPDPGRLLRQARARLAPGGVLFVAAFSFDHWAARHLRPRKTVFRPDRFFYFTRATLETLLIRSGFREIIVRTGLGDAADGMAFMARANRFADASRRRLSLIVPAYQRGENFSRPILTNCWPRSVDGLGNRDYRCREQFDRRHASRIVERYENHPRVTVVWEDRPQRERPRGARRAGADQRAITYLFRTPI